MISITLNLKKYSCFSLLAISLLAGCATDESKTEQSPEPVVESTFTVVQNEQQFTVESYEEELRTFIAESQDSPLEREALYREIVHSSLRDKGVSYDHLEYWMFAPPTNLGTFEKTLDKLKERKVEIDQAVEEALTESAELLPGEDKEDKTVHILPSLPEEAHAMEAVNFVTGVVWSNSQMVIFIDPRASVNAIKHTVAHEYHHTIYNELDDDPSSHGLLELSIIEGKAESFTKLLYPDIQPPWTEPLSKEEKSTVLPLFMEHLNTYDHDINQLFHNGDYAKGIPTWSTYRIGYEWVQDYLTDHPDLSVREWTRLNQEKFLPSEN